ncbi:MAG: hypothetical protein P8M28_02175 [Alphaproteobacteria bacterium]|jgi:hypothetical protein|nr:hypothetical protein [Alphaproteobacteria bacterium]
MTRHTLPPVARLSRILPGIAVTLLILSASASANTNERDDLRGDLSRYDRFVPGQVGGD